MNTIDEADILKEIDRGGHGGQPTYVIRNGLVLYAGMDRSIKTRQVLAILRSMESRRLVSVKKHYGNSIIWTRPRTD